MPFDTKHVIIFFAGLFALVILLVSGTSLVLVFIPKDRGANGGNPLPGLQERTRANPAGGAGPTYQIQNGPHDGRPIIYGENGFMPPEITITSSDAIGCIITVINRSRAPLRVGVNPHNSARDPGADYGVILPGRAGLLDVRYIGLEQISLHNHALPNQGFRVVYGSGCR